MLVSVPTRWGNQLNGNSIRAAVGTVICRPIVPTRWGNQLNGNWRNSEAGVLKNFGGPHSLGKSIEWKLRLLALIKLSASSLFMSPLAGEIN